ncbi:MAG TPA: translation initiation factor [Verrucomicrobiae bacterium]|nr:translation initiation factor [Verrucomicrobiae bacterium]
MAKKQKLDLTPTGAGLNNPFAALDVGGLPAGPISPSPAAAQSKPDAVAKPSKFGRVVLRREKAHRGGKTVIVIHDFAPNISYNYIETLAGRLKAACGCGGTTKDRAIEIQGDQPGRIRAFLEEEGFRVAGVS